MAVKGTPWRPADALASFCRMEIQYMRAHPEDLARYRAKMIQIVKDERAGKQIQHLSNEELLTRAKDSFDDFLGSSLTILGGDLVYKEKHDALMKRISQAEQRASEGNMIAILLDPVKSAGPYYRLHVHGVALLNAIVVAVDIYRAAAESKKLPSVLPVGCPVDPYSGQAFAYEMTDAGFVLRCRTAPVDSSTVREFEFRLRE